MDEREANWDGVEERKRRGKRNCEPSPKQRTYTKHQERIHVRWEISTGNLHRIAQVKSTGQLDKRKLF